MTKEQLAEENRTLQEQVTKLKARVQGLEQEVSLIPLRQAQKELNWVLNGLLAPEIPVSYDHGHGCYTVRMERRWRD